MTREAALLLRDPGDVSVGIERDPLGLDGEDGVERVREAGLVLIRKTVEEIKVHALEAEPARSLDEACRLARGLEAMDRLLGCAQSQNIVLMCAEEDPLHCHRFLLICPALVQRGIVPLHLRRGAALETQRDAEDRLLQLHGFADVTSNSLFSQGRAAALEDALRLQSEQYGFRSSPEAIEYF